MRRLERLQIKRAGGIPPARGAAGTCCSVVLVLDSAGEEDLVEGPVQALAHEVGHGHAGEEGKLLSFPYLGARDGCPGSLAVFVEADVGVAPRVRGLDHRTGEQFVSRHGDRHYRGVLRGRVQAGVPGGEGGGSRIGFCSGFTFLLLIHLTVVVTKLSEQNKELIQEMGLRDAPAPEQAAPLLVIVPAYNEGQSIRGVLEELKGAGPALDIVVVNDGSYDDTSAAARATGLCRVIDLPKNLGIGGAVQTGFKYAARNGYQAAVQFDGDGQHVAAEIVKLLEALERGGSIGSRFLGERGG